MSVEGSARVHEITLDDCRKNRRNALRRMRMTLKEYRAITRDECHISCCRPEGVDLRDWELVDLMDWFLGDGPRHTRRTP